MIKAVRDKARIGETDHVRTVVSSAEQLDAPGGV